MNRSDGWGIGWGHIKGRKSIHSHSCCPFARGEITMERHGVDKPNHTNKTRSPSPSEAGHDEVDNGQSKLLYPINAMPISQTLKQRPYSWNYEQPEGALREDSKTLSKSWSEIFPPYLYCSDKSDAENNDLQRSNNSQYQSIESNQLLDDDSDYSDYETEASNQTQRAEFQRQQSVYEETRTKDTYFFKIWHLLPVIACVLLTCVFSDLLNILVKQDNSLNASEDVYDKMKFYNDMSAIGKIYKLNQDSILQLQVGISSISEREDTDSFIFVYDSDKQNFNLTVFNEFINDIASMASRYLRNESATVRHVVVDTSSIRVKNSEELIHKYSDDIIKGGVMVMRAVEMLPSSLAMALHYYCDVFNPLVKKSAMFFTLDIGNCSDKMSTHSYIEKCLKRKWSSVPSDFIDPLLARVVSVVVDVTRVF